MRATGRPFYLYDTRGIKRLHLHAKISQFDGEKGDDGDHRQGEADDPDGRAHRRTADGFVEHKDIDDQRHRNAETANYEACPFTNSFEPQVATNGPHDGSVDIRYRLLALGAFAEKYV